MDNQNLIRTLEEIGLSENESKVYFAVLSLGPTTILSIARTTGIKRSTVYSVVDSLKSKGLMNTEVSGFKNKFAAVHPSRLEAILDQRKNVLEKNFTDLLALYNLKGKESFIKHYDGMEGVKEAYESMIRDIKPREEYYILANQDLWFELDKKYFENFLLRRSKLNINVKMLLENTEIAKKFLTLPVVHKAGKKLLPKSTKLTTNLVVTPQRVLVHQLIPPIQGIVIESKSIVEMHQQIFTLLWNSTK